MPVVTGYRGRREVVSRTDPRDCKIPLTLAALFRFIRTVDRPQRPHTMTTNPPQIVFDHIVAFEVSKQKLVVHTLPDDEQSSPPSRASITRSDNAASLLHTSATPSVTAPYRSDVDWYPSRESC